MPNSKVLTRALLAAVVSVALCGCFDLTQSVALDRDGAGSYGVAISASGYVGTAIKNGKTNADIGDRNAQTTTVIENGVTTRTSTSDFRSLSDLSLSSETIGVHITGHDLFGLGATHAIFRRSFHIGDAEKRAGHGQDDATARNVIASIFGNHFYQFSVTLPGSIDWIAPMRIGDAQIKPTVSADGHTITWRMPLEELFETQALNYSVGFSTWGALKDAQSQPGKHEG